MRLFKAECATTPRGVFEAMIGGNVIGLSIDRKGEEQATLDLSDEDALKLRDWLTEALRGTDARPQGVVVSFDRPPILPLRADEWEIRTLWTEVSSDHKGPDGAGWWLVQITAADTTQVHLQVWARRREARK